MGLLAFSRYQPVPAADLPLATRKFIGRYIRSVEELEILLLVSKSTETIWSVRAVYDVVMSTLQSVGGWLDELAAQGFLEKLSGPAGYRYRAEEELRGEVAVLEQYYKTMPVRVIEAIYKRDTDAAQSFADAFKFKKTDTPPPPP